MEINVQILREFLLLHSMKKEDKVTRKSYIPNNRKRAISRSTEWLMGRKIFCVAASCGWVICS
jgi:hypothetical protein